MHLSKLFLLLLAFFSYEISAAQPHKTLVAPINKDVVTSLYTTTLNHNESYVIDLTAPFPWYVCPLKHPYVICRSPPCLLAQSYPTPACNNIQTSEAQNNNPLIPCSCIVTPLNPITNSCASAQLSYKDFTISTVKGNNPSGSLTFNHTYISCASQQLLESLPQGVIGLAGLSRAPLALSSQFTSSSLRVSKKFAVCLPNTNTAPGLLFFGDGPYNLMPPTPFDVASILAYTPLLQVSNSPDYYIDIKAISIGGKVIGASSKSLEVDRSGKGGVKLSTVVPYTLLRDDIYNAFISSFENATQGLPRVDAVSPFSLCYFAPIIGFSQVGLRVPQIDLELGNGKNWTIFGANSMKLIGPNTACLAFLNGGKTAEQAVVIGSFQMENNFLLFDLENLMLGFSSTLFFIKTTCGNFNFTGVL